MVIPKVSISYKAAGKICWCESGKKYKKWHKYLEYFPPAAYHEYLIIANSIGNRVLPCFLRIQGSCSGKTIRSHSVQRNGTLSRIAESGEVYRCDVSIQRRIRKGNLTDFKKQGLSKASIFEALCLYHDGKAFYDLENRPWTYSARQIAQAALRAMAKELYTKHESLRVLLEYGKIGMRGNNYEDQSSLNSIIQYKKNYEQEALLELQSHFIAISNDVDGGTLDCIGYLIFRLSDNVNVAVNGVTAPDWDFDGTQIQNSTLGAPPYSSVTANIFYSFDGIPFLLLAWNRNPNEAIERLVESLLTKPKAQWNSLMALFIVTHFENIFYKISFLDGFSGHDKNLIVKWSLSGTDSNPQGSHVLQERPPDLGFFTIIDGFYKKSNDVQIISL